MIEHQEYVARFQRRPDSAPDGGGAFGREGPHDQAKALTLEYGPDVKRGAVLGELKVTVAKGMYRISGGGVEAMVAQTGGGVMDFCSLANKVIVPSGRPLRR